MVTKTSIAPKLVAARDRGAAYLLANQRDDGAVGNPEKYGLSPYYKTVWAFAASGQTEAGNRLASWIAREVLTPEGDYAGPMRGTLQDNNYAYPNAWITIGAHKLGRYDVSTPAIGFLSTLQHAETGGFRMQRDREDAVQDVLNASQSGNAMLLAGEIDAALRVGGFLRTVLDAQPDFDREFFFVWKPGVGLRTEFPEERQFMHSVRVDNPRQAFFNIGIATAFLARLTMATGDAQWNALGGRYLEFAYRVSDGMYETAQVGKVGWGAALAYGAGGDERHLQLAERVGEAMVAQQDESGGWDNTGGYVNDTIRIEVTAEFVVLLDEMCGGLGMG